MSVWRNTTYYEVAPVSPDERFSHGGSSIQRKVDILDGSFRGRVQAAYDFIGYSVVNTSGIPFIHRVIPMNYPGLAANTFKLATDAEVLLNNVKVEGTIPPDMSNKFYVESISRTEPVAIPTGIDKTAAPFGTAASGYSRARLTLECITLPFAVISDAQLMTQGGVYKGNPDEGVALAKGWQYTRYISRRREAFNRIFTIPYGIMQTNAPLSNGAGAKLTQTGIPFREGGEHRIYTWMRVPLGSGAGGTPGLSLGNIEGCLGTVNGATFDGAQPQTLLLDSIATREYQGAFGEWLIDVIFNMIYLPHISSGARMAAAIKNKTPQPTGPQGSAPTLLVGTAPVEGGPLLNAGVATGWNYVADMDYQGNWDYYASRSAVYDNTKKPPALLPASGQPPYLISDFSAFFRPPQ